MSDSEGTYAALIEMQREKPAAEKRPKMVQEAKPEPSEETVEISTEDLASTPYISQNYRFTEEDLRWLRQQAFKLTDRLGTKVSQNTILRVALAHLKELCDKNPRSNPLVEALSKLKK